MRSHDLRARSRATARAAAKQMGCLTREQRLEELRELKLAAIRKGQVLPETKDGPEFWAAYEESKRGRG
jgi:hypothetical protein